MVVVTLSKERHNAKNAVFDLVNVEEAGIGLGGYRRGLGPHVIIFLEFCHSDFNL